MDLRIPMHCVLAVRNVLVLTSVSESSDRKRGKGVVGKTGRVPSGLMNN